MSFNFDWQFLRTFFGLQYFRYLILWFSVVPFAVVALRDVPEKVQIPIQDRTITIHTELPFNWVFLWSCSIIYVVAWAIYLCRVPGFVKRYNSYTIYNSYNHSERWIVWEWYHYLKGAREHAVDILIEKQIAKEQPGTANTSNKKSLKDGRPTSAPTKGIDETWITFARTGKRYRLGLGPATHLAKDIEKELFWELFGATAGSRAISRTLIWALLAISGLMFLFTVAQHIGSVLSHLGWTLPLGSYACSIMGAISQKALGWLGCL